MKLSLLAFLGLLTVSNQALAGLGSLSVNNVNQELGVTLYLPKDSGDALIKALGASPNMVEVKNDYTKDMLVFENQNPKFLRIAKHLRTADTELRIKIPLSPTATVVNSSRVNERGGSVFLSVTDKIGSPLDSLRKLLMSAVGPNVKLYFSNGRDNFRVPNAALIFIDPRDTNGAYADQIDCAPSFERKLVNCHIQLNQN